MNSNTLLCSTHILQEEIDASAECVLNAIEDDIRVGSIVGIKLVPGMERILRSVIMKLHERDVDVMIKRRAVSVITRDGTEENTFPQYEYDHRYDVGLFLGKRFVERKIEVMRTAYEQNKEIAENFAGVLVVEEEKENIPVVEKEDTIHLNDKQKELWELMNEKMEQLILQYRIRCIYSYAPFTKQKD